MEKVVLERAPLQVSPFIILDISILIDFTVNLAFELSLRRNRQTQGRLRVGILDLDIFGPSIPVLMGLQNAGEPSLTESMGLLPFSESSTAINLTVCRWGDHSTNEWASLHVDGLSSSLDCSVVRRGK